jgi:hypothetical protein
MTLDEALREIERRDELLAGDKNEIDQLREDVNTYARERDEARAKVALVTGALEQWGHDVDCARYSTPANECDCNIEDALRGGQAEVAAFLERIQAVEWEACAKVADSYVVSGTDRDMYTNGNASGIAAAIRARSATVQGKSKLETNSDDETNP